MVNAILEGMQWLNLNWDGEVTYQSQRLQRYRDCAGQLISKGKAYRCFCSKEELAVKREQAAAEKRDYRYRDERTCLRLSPEEIDAKVAAGAPFVVRLIVAEAQKTAFIDEVYGEISVQNAQLDDFVLLRTDGYPTYHLAVVVDDNAMGITHVIRGDDHLSNTPKHILLYQALGLSAPKFAHVPLILGPDKRRLSKRHGATAVGEYEKQGYLNTALVNFLSLLGWSPGEDREILTLKELTAAFDLSGIARKSAVFDEKKLEWMNGQYIMSLDLDRLAELATPWLVQEGLATCAELDQTRPTVTAIMRLLQPRLRRLSEVPERAAYFFRQPAEYDAKGIAKHWKAPVVPEQLAFLRAELAGLSPFSSANIEPAMRKFAEANGRGIGEVIHPLRLALTGSTFSPSIFEVMELLGKGEVLSRIDNALRFIKKQVGAAKSAV